MQENPNNNNNINSQNILSEYKFCEVIDRGSFSKIFKGKHLNKNKTVAIKEILVEQKIKDNEEIIDKFDIAL